MGSPAQAASVWQKNTGTLGSSRRASTTAPFERSTELLARRATTSTTATAISPAISLFLSRALRRYSGRTQAGLARSGRARTGRAGSLRPSADRTGAALRFLLSFSEVCI